MRFLDKINPSRHLGMKESDIFLYLLTFPEEQASSLVGSEIITVIISLGHGGWDTEIFNPGDDGWDTKIFNPVGGGWDAEIFNPGDGGWDTEIFNPDKAFAKKNITGMIGKVVCLTFSTTWFGGNYI